MLTVGTKWKSRLDYCEYVASRIRAIRERNCETTIPDRRSLCLRSVDRDRRMELFHRFKTIHSSYHRK